MADQLPQITGVMACTHCLTVKAFGPHEDFERNGGKAWKDCPGCREPRWFIPFALPHPTVADIFSELAAVKRREALHHGKF